MHRSIRNRWLRAALAALALAVLPGAAAAAPFAGGGWEVGYQSFDPGPVNDALRQSGMGYPELPAQFLVFGGGGTSPLPMGDGGWSLTGFGAGGQAEARKPNGPLSRLALGYGGVRVGYERAVTDRLALGAGLGLAVGGLTLTAMKAEAGTVSGGLQTPQEVSFSRFLVLAIPDAGATLQLTPTMRLRLGVGYTWDPGVGTWKNVAGTSVGTEPALRMSGLRLGLTLLFGSEVDVRAETPGL
ncbi:MAG TPA: hypothetical protein VIK90_05935 [Limnochordales bacterium]